ncbi:DinB family protein [Pseudogemmobacter sp. W21_MBD1_M6]|uniref:DinB family protein n=1 Tax=Pseudogemmobacter sp. W21_MBD1_M6 TaxID=3240271 RepID=UPI003F98755A
MITPEYCQTMARYNRWQNKGLLSAANVLDEAALTRDCGAFFGSVAATFSHLMWGDHLWMSRFDGWDAPQVGIADSVRYVPDWADLRTRRTITDARIVRWADALRAGDLAGDMTWFSGALNREVTRPKALLIAHFFNHQTHHRGQIHAMLTAAGATPTDTDLFIMPEDA